MVRMMTPKAGDLITTDYSNRDKRWWKVTHLEQTPKGIKVHIENNREPIFGRWVWNNDIRGIKSV